MFGFSLPHIRRGKTVRRRAEYNPESKFDGCVAFFVISFMVLILLGVPYGIFVSEQSHYVLMQSLEVLGKTEYKEIEQITSSAAPVYIKGAEISAIASDPEFGIYSEGGIALSRETEYCQWQEISNTRCETCERQVRAKDGSTSTETYNCNCETTFNYIKGWHSHPIPSLLFNQPGNHHNPLRDPFPSKGPIVAQDVLLYKKQWQAILSPELTKRAHAPWRKLVYSPGGLSPEETRPPRTGGWKSWLSKLFTAESHNRSHNRNKYIHYETLAALPKENLPQGFVYAGDGYFYNAYEASIAERLLKGFFQYAEGTLFDWQLGDVVAALTGSCTAGDIRIKYKVQNPKKLSVLATAVPSRHNKKDPVRLENMVLEDGSIHKALVYSGSKTPAQMIQAQARESRTSATLARVVLFVWAIPVTFLAGAYIGRDFGQSFFGFLFGLLAVFTGTIAFFWSQTWGTFSAQYPFLFAAVTAALTNRLSPPTHAEPGLRAAWCMLAKFAGLPPEWRVQASYRAEYAPKPLPEEYVPSRQKRTT